MKKIFEKKNIGIFLLVLFIMKSTELFAFEDYKVVDGDSLEQGKTRIRLIDIDAPELFQECYDQNDKLYECGKMSLNELNNYIKNEIVCEEKGVDRYKRKLMECFDQSGKSINRQMVLNGWALSYGDRFIEEEKFAKDAKFGMWNGRFMRPELYRALNKTFKNSKKMKKR